MLNLNLLSWISFESVNRRLPRRAFSASAGPHAAIHISPAGRTYVRIIQTDETPSAEGERSCRRPGNVREPGLDRPGMGRIGQGEDGLYLCGSTRRLDRKSTRLNSSHPSISYAVFCLKKKITTSFP